MLRSLRFMLVGTLSTSSSNQRLPYHSRLYFVRLERKWCNTICASHSLQSATTYVFGPVDFAKQNLTSRTTRCSMFYASLRSFKTWALRIPRRYCTLYFLHTSTILAGSWPDEARSDSSVKKRRPYHSVWPSFLINQRLPIILAIARKKVMQYDLCVALLLQIVCPTFPMAKAWSDR